jgi:hypothetical protein
MSDTIKIIIDVKNGCVFDVRKNGKLLQSIQVCVRDHDKQEEGDTDYDETVYEFC